MTSLSISWPSEEGGIVNVRPCQGDRCRDHQGGHQPTDITTEDLQRAADGSGISLDEATANLRSSLDKVDQAQTSQSSV
jgi:hypothetical protein